MGDRAKVRILQDLTDLDCESATQLLKRSGKSVKLALLMHWTDLSTDAGTKLLAEHKANLRFCVDSYKI